MRREIVQAVEALSALRQGDAVRVTLDGREHVMYVSREARRSDGAFGSYESTRITVTFGPGRYATEVTAERIAAGTQMIAKV